MPAPPDDDTRSWRRRLFELVFSNLTAVFAAVVAISYGVTRPAYDSFYAAIGLTPDDVGLSQVEIIFRMALNISREAFAIVGIGAIFYLIRLAIEKALGGSSSARRWQVWSSTIGGAIIAGLLAWIALDTLPSANRTTVVVGFVAVCVLGFLASPFLVKPPKKRPLTLFVIVLLAIASVAFQSYSDGARQAGLDFLRTGVVRGAWSFVLGIRHSRIQLVEVAGDPAHVCLSKATYVYIGGTDSRSYVIVQRSHADYVARVSNDDYGLRYIQAYGPTRCITSPPK